MDKQVAYSQISIKSWNPQTRRFKGIASSSSPDRMQDVVEPKGAQFKLPIPFLHQHDPHKPVGHIDRAKVVGKDIEIEGFIERFESPPSLKERVDVAAAELESGLVRGLSIGFAPKEYSFIKETGGIHFTKWEWLELSMVTIPANSDATIRSIKSIAQKQMTSPGRVSADGGRLPTSAGASASNSKGTGMKTQAQVLAELKEARQQKHARMAELTELRSTEARRFNDDERKEFDALADDIGSIDDDIRVASLHAENIPQAKAVNTGTRGAPYFYAKKANDVEPSFKGEEGVKQFIAKTIATIDGKKGMYRRPSEVAEHLFGKTNPTLVAVMKANEVAGGGTGTSEALAELVSADNRFTGDFVDFLYGATVFDRLPLMDVPANVTIKGIDGAYTGYWTGESKAIKMSQGSASATSTRPLKVAGLTVLSNELIRDSSPAALAIVGNALREALSQVVDTKFFSADAASDGVSPAGILNGLSAISTNGGDAQSIITDVRALFAPFVTAKNMGGGFAWVMTPTTAIALSLMKNALGQTEYPTINGSGGTWLGYPVYVGDNVGAGDVILIKPSQIWKIGDRGVELSVSQDATIEQSSAPVGATDTPVAMTEYMTSMFQSESTAIKVVRSVNWGKKYASAVAYVGDAAYGTETS